MSEVRAKKALGQHFLTDLNIARKICDSLTERAEGEPEAVILSGGIGSHLGLLGSHFDGYLYIFQPAFQSTELLQAALNGVYLGHQGTSGGGVIPEIGRTHALIEFGYFLFKCCGVKDSSRARKDGCAWPPCQASRDRYWSSGSPYGRGVYRRFTPLSSLKLKAFSGGSPPKPSLLFSPTAEPFLLMLILTLIVFR